MKTLARCGYDIAQGSSSSIATTRSILSSGLPNQYTLMRGDTLSQGRYRILNQITLPEPQQRQGTAWSAIDTSSSQRHVVIREIAVPQEMARTSSANSVVSAVAQRLQKLGQREGFPQVIDLFSDRKTFFLVLLYPEGESLAILLKRQGGALPEPMVAEYAYHACGRLPRLPPPQPRSVPVSVNPETIVINE